MILRILICEPLDLYKKFGAALIKKVDGGSGSHVAIEVSLAGGAFVYEAVWPKVKKSTYAEWSTHYSIVKSYQFVVPNSHQFLVYEWLEKKIGKRYSIPQLFLILLDYIIPKNYRPINGSNKYVCSELALDFAKTFFDAKTDETSDTFGVYDAEKLYETIELKGGFK